MLNADSSTLKSESDVHRRKTPPIIPSVAALSRMSLTTLDDLRDRGRRQDGVQLAHEVGGLVGPSEEPEERQREEDERHEREQREVRDHRREVRPAVGEELAERLVHRRSMFPA